jgi:hypothetical protein
MARGQKEAADKQLKTTNAVAGAENAEQGKLESTLIPGYTSLMDTGYMNPAEEHAAATSEMGAATSPFETAKFEAGNRAAATRNPADLTAQQDQLALDEGRTAGEAASNLQKEKMANQEAGMYGLGELRGQDIGLESSMYGLGPGTLNARAAGGGWSQGFKDVAGSISGFGKKS